VILISVAGGIYGISQTAFSELIAPLDGDSNICGYNSTDGYPYLYIYDLSYDAQVDIGNVTFANMFYTGVCVKECPTSAN
jgi:hypothetical protein